jgi:acetyltransferase-like isoleucine patch superfamily enzyme
MKKDASIDVLVSRMTLDQKIGQCVVIASHAVVNKDIPDFTLAGGIPAKPLRATVERQMETAG